MIGAGAGSFSDPGSGAKGDNIRVEKGDNGIVRDNLIGFSGGNGASIKDADGWQVEGNEIRGNGTDNTELNGVRLEKSDGATVRGNLVAANKGTGIDTKDGNGVTPSRTIPSPATAWERGRRPESGCTGAGARSTATSSTRTTAPA